MPLSIHYPEYDHKRPSSHGQIAITVRHSVVTWVITAEAPNTSVPGTCERWLVNYVHCHSHRVNNNVEQPSHPSTCERDGRTDREDKLAELWADILAEGLDQALSGLVVDYLGKVEQRRLQRRAARSGMNCQPLADAAKALLDLGDTSHQMIGRAIGDLLPPGTPPFVRKLASKVGDKLPQPWDAKITAAARGLQVLGIYLCMIQLLPPAQCACLMVLTTAVSTEVVKEKVANLIHDARQDLAGGEWKAAS